MPTLKPKRTYSWVSSKLAILETGKYGTGVFAKEIIKKDEIIAISGGYIFTIDEFNKLPEKVKYLTFQVEENFFMGIKKSAEIEANFLFNHSCNPNVGNRGQISLVAMWTIPEEEECTLDYATTLFRIKGQKQWRMKCDCGAANCRKIITDDDWKFPELQERYEGYFQYFLQEKIKRLRGEKMKYD